MPHTKVIPLALVTIVAWAQPAASAVKKVPYPEVKATLAEAFKPDAGFNAMHKAFADAVAKKDAKALFALVGPTFVWRSGGVLVDQFDLGASAVQNFKVVFGFRAAGAKTDGGVDDGPYWDTLASFAEDSTFFTPEDTENLVCSPTTADVADEDVFEQAERKIGDDAVWYVTLAETPVAKAPGDTGAPIATVGTVVMPMLSSYPPSTNDKAPPKTTHFEVLLPSGKSGWVPASAARPFDSDRLCYAKTESGEYKIVAYDESESE